MKHVLMIALLALPFTVAAQERAAGGTLEAQASWSALSSQIKAVDGKVGALDGRVNQVTKCGVKGMVYAPGAAGIDGDGCLMPALVQNIITCGNAGQVYSQAQNKCIAAGATASHIWIYIPNVPYSGVSQHYPSCPNGTGIGTPCTTVGANCRFYMDNSEAPNSGTGSWEALRCS